MKLRILSLIGAASMFVYAPGQAQELVYGSYLPPAHNVNTVAIAPLVKALGDELPMQLMAGGQLYGARAALPSLSRGIADAGPVVTTYYASELKHVNILSNLMMLADDPLVMLGATVDTIFNDCPQCLEDFRNQGTVYLAGYAAGGYSLLCNKQVTNLAEVAGKRVRTTGPLGRLANAMKATPVSMTVSDFVEALQRGMVDCVMGPVAFFQAYPIADSVTHIYDYGKGVFNGLALFVINRDSWNSLSDSQRKLLLNELPAASARATVAGFIGDDLRARRLISERDAVITRSGGELDALMEQHNRNEIELTIKGARQVGVDNPEALVHAFLANIEKWTGIVEAASIDLEDIEAATNKFEILLRDHIYSKLDPAKL